MGVGILVNKWGCRNPIYQIKVEVRGRISLNYTKNSKKVGAGDKSIWHFDYLGM